MRVWRSQRSILEMSVKDDFQIGEIRLHYMSFILQSKISIKVRVSVAKPEGKTCEQIQKGVQ